MHAHAHHKSSIGLCSFLIEEHIESGLFFISNSGRSRYIYVITQRCIDLYIFDEYVKEGEREED